MNRAKSLLPVLVVAAFLAGAAGAAGPPSEEGWALLSDAAVARLGPDPNSWAIELGSACGFNGDECDLKTFRFSGVHLDKAQGGLVFAAISELSAEYSLKAGRAASRSPRFQLNVDTDGDGVPNGNVSVYLGLVPASAGEGGRLSTGNLLQNRDSRFDLSEIGGSKEGTYGDALSLIGSLPVLGVQFVVDGGWEVREGQTVLVHSLKLNDIGLSVRVPPAPAPIALE